MYKNILFCNSLINKYKERFLEIYKGFKVKLRLSNEQKHLFHKCFGYHRFIYNWCISFQKTNHEFGNKFIGKYDLQKMTIALKNEEGFEWMKELPAKVAHQASRDASASFTNFFKKNAKFPRFKSRKDSKQSFWNPQDRIKFDKNFVTLQKIGKVKLQQRNRIPFGSDTKYQNPRISFDGVNYWISVSVLVGDNQTNDTQKTIPIGIDLGIKTLFTCSNDMVNHKPNTKRLEKKLKRLQRRASKLYIKYRKKEKSKNLMKLEFSIRKLQQKITNVRMDNLHKFTSELVKLNPHYICIEDLDVSKMMKNSRLAKLISDAKFFEIRRMLEYKCKWNDIPLIIADRYFPSSKTCHHCGQIKDLTLSDRVYECDCGYVEDRDVNASMNLRDYPINYNLYKYPSASGKLKLMDIHTSVTEEQSSSVTG